MTESPSIVLFQTDLRLADNPALSAAVDRGEPLICLFVWNPDAQGYYDQPGAASRWWLHHSLQSLAVHIREAGNALIIRSGQAEEIVSKMIARSKDPHLFWNRSCEPAVRKTEERILSILKQKNVEGTGFDGTNLIHPSDIHTQSRKPYTVFTPFWKRLQSQLTLSPSLAAPKKLPPAPSTQLKSESLASLKLLPRIDWAEGIRSTWSPGENGARTTLNTFLRATAKHYATDRDRPDLPHTSRLSPHLHFGEISPRRVWQAVTRKIQNCGNSPARKSLEAYLRQIGWREFARHLLYHFPRTIQEPLYEAYRKFPWEPNEASLNAWQKGLTGYPIVDAGMRELWHTGWMHNRVRMVTASFLTKDLLLHWETGAAWFWDTLVDADLANNTLGWQWVAGCGADASPFFRIFNPVTQGRKFDPDGLYVRKWVPELAALPTRWIHQPWDAPPLLLVEAHIRLGETYPYPIIDHTAARNRALLAYRQFTKKKRSKTSSPASD